MMPAPGMPVFEKPMKRVAQPPSIHWYSVRSMGALSTASIPEPERYILQAPPFSKVRALWCRLV